MVPAKASKKKSPTDKKNLAGNTSTAPRNQLHQDDIEALPGAVTNLESAEKYLASVLLRQADEPLTLLHLAGILFQITQMVKPIPLAITNAIRVTAFILKHQAVSEIAEVVAKAAAEQLSTSLSTNIVNNIIAAIAPQVASIHTAVGTIRDALEHSSKLRDSLEQEKEEEKNDLKTAAERIKDAVDTLYKSIEDCNNSYKLLTPSLEFTQDRLNTLTSHLAQHPNTLTQAKPPMPPPTLPTYSSAAAAHLPPSFDKAVARASLRAKQILLDPTTGHSLFPPEATNTSIAKQISDILAEICNDGAPTGTIASRKLLETHLDSMACIHDRTFAIVVQFLLITYDIEQDDFKRHIETENFLPSNSITSIRWIKPPQRRTREQCTTFALLQIKDAETANNILKEGLCIDALRYAPPKSKLDPIIPDPPSTPMNATTTSSTSTSSSSPLTPSPSTYSTPSTGPNTPPSNV
ncbi:uncharacterized protein EDB91DRAFT_1247886 [Suillus paluster]|uniref:uncharacterized protein n=1 Tax=Suillus paluster TaxID=48578 RepID=UPI001B87E634|nr:uncharacterized protein EDB91DRAFT_1247886 [Suillus paluster]KAG1741833.1 hypothetical protein EDB91DRAFT_1247886 [Suillus paluster]